MFRSVTSQPKRSESIPPREEKRAQARASNKAIKTPSTHSNPYVHQYGTYRPMLIDEAGSLMDLSHFRVSE